MYLKNIPSPILVSFVSGNVIEIPQAFNCFGSKQVVRIGRLYVKVICRRGFRVEMRDFGGQKRRLPGKRQVASVGQFLCQLHKKVVTRFLVLCISHVLGRQQS